MYGLRMKALGAVTVLALLLVIGGGIAEGSGSIPDRPLEFIVPFGTGGGTDLTARLMAPELQQELGVPVQVVNKPGGGGWVAWHMMANWKPDEWKIGYVNLPHIFAYLNPKLKRSETVESWNFFFLHTVDPGLLMVREGDPRYSTLHEFIKYVQENPGKVVLAAHGVGGDDFIGVKQIELRVPNFKVKMIHNDSDAKSISQLAGGHVHAVAGNVAAYASQILEGKIRPLALHWYERTKFLPSVPTFQELTGKKVIHYAGRTVAGPPGMPEDRKTAIIEAFERAVKHPGYQLRMVHSSLSIDMMKGKALEEFLADGKELVKEIAYWKEE